VKDHSHAQIGDDASQNDLQRQWAPRLERSLPDYRVVVPETEAEARQELLEADAAYGWVPPDMLPAATKLRWLQNPQAGPAPGYYYPALIAHPVVVCNPRGIYFDHISHHILMFVLALSRGLPDYLEAQRQRRWDPAVRAPTGGTPHGWQAEVAPAHSGM
jgi:phosphoglycerate dehydrogenase-like enzyme